jgi:general secretion pathway protein L
MSEDLILQPRDDGSVRWSVIERASGTRRLQGVVAAGEAMAAAPSQGISRTICLLPSERLFTARIALAARSEAEALRAAPFLIEDELASRLEDTCVAAGPRDAEGQRWVLAAANSDIEVWLERLTPALVRPVLTVPDCLVIADPDAALTLYDRGDAVLYLYGPEARDPGKAAGGALDSTLFDRVVSALIRPAGRGRIAVSPSLGLAGENLTALRSQALDIAASAAPASLLQALPPLFGAKWLSTLDWRAVLLPMRRAGILAACAAFGFAALLGGEAVYYQMQASRFDAASVARFQAALPEVTRRVVPAEAARLLEARINGMGGGETSSFLQLTAALAELVADNERVRIDHLRFDQARAELRVSAIYTDFSDFDGLSEQAARLGLRLTDGGARESDGGIEGEFVVVLR